MATMIDGESYLGRVLIRPLSQSGDITLYLWPLRCLKTKIGGPTFGVDIKREEILRFDPHGPKLTQAGQRGHWHKDGYDKLGGRGSHQDFHEGLVDIAAQTSWSLALIREQGKQLLEEAGHPEEAASLDDELVQTATEAIMAQLEKEGDLRSKAIEQGLIST